MTTYVVQSADASVGNRLPSQGFFVAGDDYAVGPRAAVKTISGHVYDTSGAPVVGATVELYRQGDSKKVRSTTSVTGGSYSFPRDPSDPYTYFTVAYSLAGGSTQVHGVSNRGMVPV